MAHIAVEQPAVGGEVAFVEGRKRRGRVQEGGEAGAVPRAEPDPDDARRTPGAETAPAPRRAGPRRRSAHTGRITRLRPAPRNRPPRRPGPDRPRARRS